MSYNPSTNQSVLAPTTVAASASPYTVLPADQFVEMSAAAAAATVVNLPAATGSGRVIVVKRMDAFGKKFPVKVTPNGTDTIDGINAPLPLTAQFQSYSFEDANAGAWDVF